MTYIYDLFFSSAVQLLPINVNVPRSWKSLKTKLSPWKMFKNYVWQQTVITELCTKDGSVSIKTRNPQILVTETYKVRNYLAPTIVKDLLVKTQNFYYLKNNSQFSRPVLSQHIIALKVFLLFGCKYEIGYQAVLKKSISEKLSKKYLKNRTL